MSVLLQFRYPNPALIPYVKCYFETRSEEPICDGFNYALPAMPEQSLCFNLENIPGVKDIISKRTDIVSPNQCGYLLGQFSQSRLHLEFFGIFHLFSTTFHPTGFFRLFGIPMNYLADSFIAVDSILGNEANETSLRLREAKTIDERITIIEPYLLRQLNKKKIIAYNHTDDVVMQLLHKPNLSLSEMSDQSCLSERQFRRKFIERTGISPNTFARICRAHKAFEMKQSNKSLSWRRVAFESGYTDQSHLIKEIKLLMGLDSPGIERGWSYDESGSTIIPAR